MDEIIGALLEDISGINHTITRAAALIESKPQSARKAAQKRALDRLRTAVNLLEKREIFELVRVYGD